MKYVVALLVLAMMMVGGTAVYLVNCPNELNESTAIVLNKGESVQNLSEKLQKAGVINSSLLFRVVVRWLKADKKLRAGEYMLTPHLNMLEVTDKFLRGDVYYRRITLPEGLTSVQIKELLENETNLSGEITLDIPEGSMLPETYTFSKGESRDSVVLQAQRALTDLLKDVWKKNQNLMLKSEKDLLILASIIEKETGEPDERQDVSAVFTNRLRNGMMLQTDPTVIYAITEGKQDLGRALMKKDLAVDSPYNTYRYYGLPPAPICHAGKDAIIAAANPSDVDYLYFVASGTGGHRFARTLAEHNQNVAQYRQILKNTNRQ